VGGWAGPHGPESAGPSPRRHVVMILVVVLVTLGLGAVIGLLVRTRGGDGGDAPSFTYAMAGPAMEPTLSHGDLVTAREIDGNEVGDEVGRGDVVVVEVPAPDVGGTRRVIKRVVAVAGDEIASVSDELLIDGQPVDEPYLAPGTPTTNVVQQEVPAGHVFLLGDNRPNSYDSRIFGPVPATDIMGLVEPT
jgi:signal peptidase I